MPTFRQVSLQISGTIQLIDDYDFDRVATEATTAQWVPAFLQLLQQDAHRVNTILPVNAQLTYFTSAIFDEAAGAANFFEGTWANLNGMVATSLFLTRPDDVLTPLVQTLLEQFFGAKTPQPTAALSANQQYPIAVVIPAFGPNAVRRLNLVVELQRALGASYFRHIGAI